MLGPKIGLKFRKNKISIDEDFERAKPGEVDDPFLCVIEVLGLSLACGFINVLQMGGRSIDPKINMLEDGMCIGSDFVSVFDVLVFIMP